MKRTRTLILSLSICLFLVSVAFANYPDKNLSGVIAWGAGGGTDNASRALVPLAEKILKGKIIMQNKPGAAGALATATVYNSPADGYTLLFNAEGPAIYKVLGLGKYDYDDFEPIALMLYGIDVICVHPSTPYKTLDQLMKAAKNKPNTIKMATTGTGGVPFVLTSVFKSTKGASFNNVGFDGDGSGITALLGGHVDAMPISMMGAGAVDLIKTGKLRALAVVHDKRVSQLPNVPAITEVYPEFKKQLPIGHYYGVFVKKGTPKPIVEDLRKAFMTAIKDPHYVAFIKRVNALPLGLTGDEAMKFIKKNQSNVAWILHDAQATKVSPEKLGIPKTR